MLPSLTVALKPAAAADRTSAVSLAAGLHIVVGGTATGRTSLLRDLTGASPKPPTHAVLYDGISIERYHGTLDLAKVAIFVPADPLFDGALTVGETLAVAHTLAPGAVSVRRRKQALAAASAPGDAVAVDAGAPAVGSAPAAIRTAVELAPQTQTTASSPTSTSTAAAVAPAPSSASTLDALLSALATWLQPYGGNGIASALGRMDLQDVANVRVSQLHPHQRRMLAAAEATFHGPRVLACEGTLDDLPPAAQATLASTLRAWAKTVGMVAVVSASSSISDAALAEADQMILLASAGPIDTPGVETSAASAASSSTTGSNTKKETAPAIVFVGTLQAAKDVALACGHLLPPSGRSLLPLEPAVSTTAAAGVASAGSTPATVETAPQQQSALTLGTTAAALSLLVELHARDVEAVAAAATAAAAAERAAEKPPIDAEPSIISNACDIGNAVDVPAPLPAWVWSPFVQARLGHSKTCGRAQPPPGGATSPHASTTAASCMSLQVGAFAALGLLLQRQARLTLREPLRWFVPKLLISLAFGCFLGSMYNHPTITNFTPKVSLASYICVILTSSAGFEIPAFIEMTKRSHALIDRRWVPAWTASVASTLLSLPVSIAGSILFAAPIYYMVGYADTSARFAFFWLITLLVDVAVTAMMRWLGAFLLRPDAMKSINGTLVLFYLFCGGFLLVHPKMNKVMESIYWTNPYAYALRAIMNNEWDAPEYQRVIPVPNGHGGYVSMTLQQYFSSYVYMDMGTSWRLGSMAFLIGYALLFAAICLPLTLRCKRPRAAVPASTPWSNPVALENALARASAPSPSAAAPTPVIPTMVQFSAVSATLPTQPLGAWWDPVATHRSASIQDVSFTARSGEVTLLHAPDARTIAVARRVFEGRVTAAWHSEASSKRGGRGGCMSHVSDAIHRLATELSGRDHDVHAKAGKAIVQTDAAVDAAAISAATGAGQRSQQPNALLAPSLLWAACAVVKAPYTPPPAGLTVEEAVASYVAASAGYALTDVAARVQQVLSLVGLDGAADRKARADALYPASWQAAALALAHAVCSHRSVIVVDASVSSALLNQSAVAEALILGGLCRRIAAGGFAVIMLTTDALAPHVASLVHAHSVASLTGQPTAATAYSSVDGVAVAASQPAAALPTPAGVLVPPAVAFMRWALAAPALHLKAFSRQVVRSIIQRNLIHLAVALFVGTLFYDLQTHDAQGASGIVTLSFLSSNFASLLVLSPGVKLYQADKPRVIRDVAAGNYPLWGYFLSSAVAEFAWSAVGAAIWTVIPFAMAGQLTHIASAGASVWLAVMLCMWGYALIAMALAAAAPGLAVAAYMEQCTITVMSILTGVFVPAPQMPTTWNWLHEALVSSHAFKSALANGLYCDPQQNGGPCPTVPLMVNGAIVNVDRYAYFAGRYGFSHADRWWHCALAAIICGVTAVVVLVVWRVAIRPRHRGPATAKHESAGSKAKTTVQSGGVVTAV